MAKRTTRSSKRAEPSRKFERIDKPHLRGTAFMRDRVGPDGTWSARALEAFRKDWTRKYGRRGKRHPGRPGGGIFFTAPVPGACNWVPLGPAPFTEGKTASFPDNSGRVCSFAIDPTTPSRLYAGTASGGVWKSTNTGATWAPMSDDQFSLAIGALAVDPNATNIVYAGTGEMVPGTDYGTYYGRGLLRSTTFGDSWSEIGAAEFLLAEIARVIVNPLDSTNLFVAASNGVWEGTASGTSWTQLSTDPCTDVVLVNNPAEPGVRRLIAGFSDIGVRQSANSGAGWSAFADVVVPGMPVGPKRTAFGVCRTQPSVIYAAFSTPDGGMLAHVARSDTWGASWAAKTIPTTGRIYQGSYNLAIQPHPTIPDTVILAVVDVFKSIDGGGGWSVISTGMGASVHADVHAITWHPTLANTFYVTCDGGILSTPDLGASWEPHNLNVSSIQLYDLSHHPTYGSILIAGSQDNGGFHYSGAPIWRRTWVPFGESHNAMEGDAVVTEIDPFDPFVHYYGTGPDSTMSVSTDAGQFFTSFWTSFPGTQWWFPFAADPHTSGVIVTGGTKVMRSIDRGTTWDEVSSPLASPVRAIGFHPTDPLVIYVGTVGGQVYRLNGPAMGLWTTMTVTTTDITLTGLPAGVGISSLAVDPAGTVWVTISNLLETEGPGEFSNDHVYRLDSGAMAWVSKSSGLVQANPVNTIVIDPADATRVFCGADRGVFSWNGATQAWTPMDEGLPNSPVMKLLIHQPSRLLRAATYGRGVWERSLDAAFCADHFIYFRDNLVDSGRTPSPDGVPHPYVAGDICYHWQSEDIVVDGANQTPSLATSPMQVFDDIVHMGVHRGANRVYITMHNRGPFAVTNVRVRAYFAGASAGLPAFPAGLLADPFLFSPGGTSAWSSVGPVFSVGRLEPGTTGLAAWDFTIPMSAPSHSCVLAFLTSTEDPFSAGTLTDPDQLVVQNRKVTLKNLSLDAMPGGSGSGSGGGSGGFPAGSTGPHIVQLHTSAKRATARIVVHAGHVPDDAILVVAVDKVARRALRASHAKSSSKAQRLRERFARLKKVSPELADVDVKRVLARDLLAHQSVHVGDLTMSNTRAATLVVWLYSKRWEPKETYSIDIVQMAGDRIAGGYTLKFANLSRVIRKDRRPPR